MSKNYSLEDLEELKRKQEKKDRWILIGVILAFGIGGIWVNWYYAITRGMYNRLLAFFSPALIIGAIYSALFPDDFSDPNRRKLPFRMWIAIIVGLLLCVAHVLAFEYKFF